LGGGGEELLRQTIEAGLRVGVIKPSMNFSKLLLAALGALWSFLLERSVALFAPRSPRGTIAATTG
jgi:hypothetical protein